MLVHYRMHMYMEGWKDSSEGTYTKRPFSQTKFEGNKIFVLLWHIKCFCIRLPASFTSNFGQNVSRKCYSSTGLLYNEVQDSLQLARTRDSTSFKEINERRPAAVLGIIVVVWAVVVVPSTRHPPFLTGAPTRQFPHSP